MSEGPSNSETLMSENRLGELPEEGSGDPNATSSGVNGYYREGSPVIYLCDIHPFPSGKEGEYEEIEMELGLGQQEEHPDQPNSAVNDDIVSNPTTVDEHESDSEFSPMNDDERTASARATDILVSVSVNTDFTKIMILDQANSAMEELVTMSQKECNTFEFEPSDHRILRAPGNIHSLPGSEDLYLESSRETATVSMNRQGIVAMLMDSKRWAAKFADLVASAIVLAVIHPGATGSYDGALQVMTAEFHIPTPLVPARESYFARYCKKLSPDTWGVVDVSLECLFPHPYKHHRRRSGCLIHELENGCSEVTWIELVEVDSSSVHWLFQPIVSSGFAFGAQRWVQAIARGHDLHQALMNKTPPEGTLPMASEGKTRLLKLMEKMVRGFFADVGATSTNMWMPLPLYGDGDIKIMVKNAKHDCGVPGGRTIVLSTSVWIPASPKRLFNFLSDSETRSKWDFLSQNHAIQESARIVIGAKPESCVSILEIKTAPDGTDTAMFYLQKGYMDPTFSYVVYAPVDVPTMSMILSGGDTKSVSHLTSGFTVFPDRPVLPGRESSGSLLTVMFHIMDAVPREDHYRLSLKSLNVAYRLITETVMLINNHAAGGHRLNSGPRLRSFGSGGPVRSLKEISESYVDLL